MRSGVALSVLREEFLIETGQATEDGHVAFAARKVTHILNRVERFLGLEYDWGARNFEEQVTISADASTGNLPSNITFTQIQKAEVQFGDIWIPLTHGIEPNDRATYGSTGRATPILKWEVTADASTFEVWPVGASDQVVRFSGQKTLGGMVKDTDTCALDGDAIVLWAAAETLGRDKKEDAAIKLDMAKRIINAVTMKQGIAKSEPINMAERPRRALRPGIDFIPPGSS